MIDRVYLQFTELERLVEGIFRGLGVPTQDARICRDVVLMADRLGIDTHGVNRLKPMYYDAVRKGLQSPVTRIETVREGPTTAVLDGCNGMGQVVAYRAMKLAISKASSYGMAMVAVRESNHYGIAGYYARMAAEAGMIGLTGTNARPAVAPTFATENKLGTNPLAFACPTDEAFPFVFDAATSIVQRGNVEVADREGRAIPPGWVTDEMGKSSTQPARILDDLLNSRAALLPLGGAGTDLGGHKGYGLGTMVEILSAALQSGPFLSGLAARTTDGRPARRRNGHFFVAIDIEAFVDADEFRSTAGSIMRELRSAHRVPGQARVYTAGEPEYANMLERERTGVPVNAGVLTELKEMARDCNLSFNFEIP